MLEYTSIQGRLFSLVVIRGQIVLLLFQCVNSLQIGHLAPLHGTRTSSHSVSSYTYERYLNSITVQNPYLKKAVFLLSTTDSFHSWFDEPEMLECMLNLPEVEVLERINIRRIIPYKEPTG